MLSPRKSSQPYFVVSSGRSGTELLAKVFGTFPNVEAHHEYLCTHVQPLAVKYYLGMASLDEVSSTLSELHGRAVFFSDAEIWMDSSNKLSWLIEGLDRILPEAKFIHLVRDGRKVVSSYYHKLGDECYDDNSVAVLQAWIDDPVSNPMPPPEKKYWWNIPKPGTPLSKDFRHWDQFQRISFHWAEVNRFILAKLENIGPERRRLYRLEDLVSRPTLVKDMADFLGLKYDDKLFGQLQRPQNVNHPRNYFLTSNQNDRFMKIAGDMMDYFGYTGTEEYEVVYDCPSPVSYGR